MYSDHLKVYHCLYCPKTFKSSNGLKYHNENIHSDEEYMKMSGIYPEAMRTTKSSKAIPPALDLGKNESLGILREFAFLATGPHSPLMKEVYGCVAEAESPVDVRDIDYDIPSVESDASATSPVLTTTYRHATPPPTAWSCFLDGTRIQLAGDEEWKYAEDLGNDEIPNVCDPSDGLRVTACERIVHVVDHLDETVQEFLVSFSSTSDNLPSLRAEVPGNHPFFVKNKGWSSMQPSRALESYRMVCQPLTRGDICLPSSHPTVLRANRMPGTVTNMFGFTDSDSDAALTLSCMKKDRQEHKSRKSKLFSIQSFESSPPEQQLNKRPMNAFMLFAKRYRVKITKAHPGKDNRAISVILGDKWKSLDQEERSHYVLEAKKLAEEHKKVNPDCWKRKRSPGQTGRAKVHKR